jgi:hypothetical protein
VNHHLQGSESLGFPTITGSNVDSDHLRPKHSRVGNDFTRAVLAKKGTVHAVLLSLDSDRHAIRQLFDL